MNFLTNILSWFLKNVNMIVGIISSVTKLTVALLNIFQPSKDDLVDKIQEWSEKIQKWLFKGESFLSKFGG